MSNKKVLKTRKKIENTSIKTRIVVRKSLKYDYLQAINNSDKKVLFGLSTQKIKGKTRQEKDIILAEKFAEILKGKKITKIVFDRSGYKYHGRIKLIADTLRKNGITF